MNREDRWYNMSLKALGTGFVAGVCYYGGCRNLIDSSIFWGIFLIVLATLNMVIPYIMLRKFRKEGKDARAR